MTSATVVVGDEREKPTTSEEVAEGRESSITSATVEVGDEREKPTTSEEVAGGESSSARVGPVSLEPLEREMGQEPSTVMPGESDSERREQPFDYFSRPLSKDLELFFNYHPQQNTLKPIPKVFHSKDGIDRKWLSYNGANHSLFCSVCFAFAKSDSDSPFTRGGMQAWKHVHQRIEEHEKSKAHRECAEAYFLRAKKSDISSLMNEKQVSAHREQVRKKRQVMQRIIDIIKLIGKRGLSYRGNVHEGGYSLDDPTLDHGNFLEMILLLSRYDVRLQEHVNDSIKQSKRQHERKGTGRGSLTTFLSKTTVNRVIDVIRVLIQDKIATEVQKAGMFSVQMDTTQDLTSRDQCAVVLHYVTDVVHERLISVIDCESATGQHFVELLKQTLEKVSIDIKNCVGHSTDGAANMRGQYKGFSALLSGEAPDQVHTWCYSHVMNLVLTDTTGVVVASASLFSLLNDIAMFTRESYKRMKLWEGTSGDTRHRRLGLIGQTRWWAKDHALTKVFGCFGKPGQALYTDVVMTMLKIEADETMKPDARVKARGYREALLRYETILTFQMFLRIFEETSPVLKYLQTSGMDILTAQCLVTGTENNLKKYASDFDGVKRAADTFVEWANKILQEQQECDVEVQTTLPEKRLKRRKKRAGELAEDEPITDAMCDYNIKIHNVVLDTVIESFNHCYAANAVLYADFGCMDPRNFLAIRTQGLPNTAMKELSKCLLKFDNHATVENLQAELTNLASHWDRLKTSLFDGFSTRDSGASDIPGEESDDPEESMELTSRQCSTCKNCAICCYLLLSQYNLLTDAYHVISMGYKFLLTLSVTQVACERTFSTLKFVKNRLRTSLTQDNLEVFLLMSTEKEILMGHYPDSIIDKVAEGSELLRRLLTY